MKWEEYKSEEFDLDENEDEDVIAADPERIEVSEGSFINDVTMLHLSAVTKNALRNKTC